MFLKGLRADLSKVDLGVHLGSDFKCSEHNIKSPIQEKISPSGVWRPKPLPLFL